MPLTQTLVAISKIAQKYGFMEKVLYGTTMSKGWTSKEVVPDIIDAIPKRKLGVQYPNININEGNLVKPIQVKTEPHVSWKPKEGAFYTLCMVDADAPTRERPEMREWLHWLVVNIPNYELNKGEVVAEYVGACPPSGTGLHRCVFLLYIQPDRIPFSDRKITKNTAKGRSNFFARHFAKKYALKELVAGNFFEVEFDRYVPEIHKQLGFA